MKVSELTGAMLDYWIAHKDPRCEGLRFEWRGDHWVGIGEVEGQDTVIIAGSEDGYLHESKVYKQYRLDSWDSLYSPSTNWAHGGPIIQRKKIDIRHWVDEWVAGFHTDAKTDAYGYGIGVEAADEQLGPTPLIAAMRCFVASTYGDTVPPLATEQEEK